MTGFFGWGNTPPESNTTQALVTELANQVATVTASNASAQTAATNAEASAANAAISETNVANLAQQATTTLNQANSAIATANTAVSSAQTALATATGAATTSAVQAQAASTSASAAASSATAAAASQAAASNSQSAAAASQTASASNAASVAAALASMNATWLGAHATDPTVDNNGSQLAVGAEYLNTAASPPQVRVYTATGWQDQDQTAEAASSNATLAATQAATSAASASQSAAQTSQDVTSANTAQAAAAASQVAAAASQAAALSSQNAAASSAASAASTAASINPANFVHVGTAVSQLTNDAGYLQGSSNLSDVANVSTARSNLGVPASTQVGLVFLANVPRTTSDQGYSVFDFTPYLNNTLYDSYLIKGADIGVTGTGGAVGLQFADASGWTGAVQSEQWLFGTVSTAGSGPPSGTASVTLIPVFAQQIDGTAVQAGQGADFNCEVSGFTNQTGRCRVYSTFALNNNTGSIAMGICGGVTSPDTYTGLRLAAQTASLGKGTCKLYGYAKGVAL